MTNPKCGATKKQDEGTCELPAGWGTDHPGVGNCKLHGGSTPNGIENARKILRQHLDPLTRSLVEQALKLEDEIDKAIEPGDKARLIGELRKTWAEVADRLGLDEPDEIELSGEGGAVLKMLERVRDASEDDDDE